MKFGVEYLSVLFLRGYVVTIDMRADGDSCHTVSLLNFFGSVPFGQGIVRPVLGKCCIYMLLAVIVELANTDFEDIVLSCICPNPFLRDFVLFGNLLGSVILSYIKIIFYSSSFIGACFEHQFNIGSAND